MQQCGCHSSGKKNLTGGHLLQSVFRHPGSFLSLAIFFSLVESYNDCPRTTATLVLLKIARCEEITAKLSLSLGCFIHPWGPLLFALSFHLHSWSPATLPPPRTTTVRVQ